MATIDYEKLNALPEEERKKFENALKEAEINVLEKESKKQEKKDNIKLPFQILFWLVIIFVGGVILIAILKWAFGVVF